MPRRLLGAALRNVRRRVRATLRPDLDVGDGLRVQLEGCGGELARVLPHTLCPSEELRCLSGGKSMHTRTGRALYYLPNADPRSAGKAGPAVGRPSAATA